MAAQNGHKEALEVLIGAGGDVNAANKVRRDGRVWWSVGGEEEGRGLRGVRIGSVWGWWMGR